MQIRYIQAAVTEEEHDAFTRFAGSNRITLNDLITVAVKEYILTRKEDSQVKRDTDPLNPNLERSSYESKEVA